MSNREREELIKKYDVRGPRYTSYPPMPFWEEAPSQAEWISSVKEISSGEDIGVYVHIPFCKEICSYCACNRIKLEDNSVLSSYVKSLLKEWEIYDFQNKNCVKTIHFGGGTPTLLTPDQIDLILEKIVPKNRKILGSFEADPRITTAAQIETFYKWGFKRLSFGVQDFDTSVQKNIGREQDYSTVKNIFLKAREIGIDDINFDLIFGLPGQTKESIEGTFEKVSGLMPDTIAFYGFAYVPKFSKNQLDIRESDIPEGSSKQKLYEFGREKLFNLGYVEIGMDHFALQSSHIFKAFNEGNLYRSFMGYSAKKVSTLIGLGASSISSSNDYFIQNEKTVDRYMEKIDQNELPIIKGHKLNNKDKLVSNIIQNIMCKGVASIDGLEDIDLKEFETDKLIEVNNGVLKVLKDGKPFLRNICMKFDYRLELQKRSHQFSRTI